MKQEDKILLLTDLCARLPYNVKVHYDRIPPSGWKMSDTHVDGYLSSIEPNWSIANGYQPQIICSGTLCGIGDVKPYLRPMSSMTKEEKEEVEVLIFGEWFAQDSGKVDGEGWIEILANYDVSGIDPGFCSDYIDWLNAHHFDYRGLIEKGLAIEAPKDMYN